MAIDSGLKAALVTGAGSGMGRAIARGLAEGGMRVALLGRDRAKLDETKASLGARSDSAFVRSCDVSDREAVARVVAEVEGEFGTIDLLVCNAGINTPKRALDVLDPEDWDRLIATNLTGAYNLVHHVLPGMRARKNGLIVQISSIAGRRAGPLAGVAYSASKFGQAALGIGIGREEREHGIRSTVIYPGEVNTPILDRRPVPVPAERRASMLQPEDVAAAVLFLAGLPPRARVPELVITPAEDDWA